MKLQVKADETRRFADPPLLDQSQALTFYLDSLFRNVLPTEEMTPPVEAVPAPVAALPVVEEAVSLETPVPPEAEATGAAFENAPFACLRIGIGSMALAVPMSSLFGIRCMPDKPVRLPESPPWVLGMLGGRDEKVQVVHLGTLLGNAGDTEAAGFRHAVIIAEGRWAIACDAAGSSLRVDPELVHWSGGHARLPWLAGIVAGELCTLLDPTGLVKWLESGTPGRE